MQFEDCFFIARCNCSLPPLHTMSFTPEGNFPKTFPFLAANTCTFPQGLPALLPNGHTSTSRLKTRNPSGISLLVLLSREEPSQRTAPHSASCCPTCMHELLSAQKFPRVCCLCIFSLRHLRLPETTMVSIRSMKMRDIDDLLPGGIRRHAS